MAQSLQIKRLSHRHRSIARDVVTGGLTPKRIQEIYGLSPGQVSVILNSPIFQVEVSRLESQMEAQTLHVRNEILDLVPQARRVVSTVLNNAGAEPTKLEVDSAFGILKLAQPAEPQKHLHQHLHAHQEVREMGDEDLRKDVFGALDYDDD